MPSFESPVDGARLFYRDYRPSTNAITDNSSKSTKLKPAILMVHGWPMNSKMFDHLALPLCEDHGYRCILPDRRGFGRSEWNGNKNDSGRETIDFDALADDLIHLIKSLQLPHGFIFVAASMGTGEAIRAVMRSKLVRDNCKGLIFLGTNLPYPIQSPDNPTAPPRELWNAILQGLRADRTAFVQASLPNIFGAHAGVEVSQTQLTRFAGMVEEADVLAIERYVSTLVYTDFRAELAQFATWSPRIPVLMLHGDSDQGVPLDAGPEYVKKLVPHAQLKIYEKAAHGLYLTHASQCIDDTLGFIADVSR